MVSPPTTLAAASSPSCLAWRCRSKSSVTSLGGTPPLPLPSLSPYRSHSMIVASPAPFPYPPLVDGKRSLWSPLLVKASDAFSDIPPVVEPETGVAFEQNLTIPGYNDPMALLGTGYREKVFAIIGVKVYAAAFYVDFSLLDTLSSWKGRSSSEMSSDPSLFKHIFEVSSKKTMNIVLVRDVDGSTFWKALNDVVSPRIKKPTPKDESALKTFRTTFENRSLTRGTIIYLTWDGTSKMLVSISSKGAPSAIDATIESKNVPFALYDAYFCDKPVSPTLKANISQGLTQIAQTT